MKVYRIQCEASSWDGCNGCDTDTYLLRNVYMTYEAAHNHLPKNHYGAGSSEEYSIIEQEVIE